MKSLACSHLFANGFDKPLRLLAAALLFCLMLGQAGCKSAENKEDARWKNTVESDAANVKKTQDAYQRRQAQLAAKKQGTAESKETKPETPEKKTTP